MESLTPLWLMRRLLQWEARRTPPTLAASADAVSTANVKPLRLASVLLLTFPANRAQGRLSHV
jgi:hypothetical protein